MNKKKPTYEELEKRINELESHQKLDDTFQNNLSLMQLIIENTRDLVAITSFDLKAEFLYISPSYKKVLGYDPEELIGKSGINFVHPDDKIRLLSVLKSYLQGKAKQILTGKKETVFEVVEYRLPLKKGGWKEMEGMVTLADKKMLFISRDITERKQAEKELQSKNEEYLAVNEELQESLSRIQSINSELEEAKEKAEESEKETKQNLVNIDFLRETAYHFVEVAFDENIYDYIGERLLDLNPNTYVILNEVDFDNKTLTTKSVLGLKGVIKKVIKLMGQSPVGNTYSIDDSLLDLSQGNLVEFKGGLHDLTFGQIPKRLASSIEKLAKIDNIYGVAFILEKRIFANATFMIPKGEKIENIQTIETFVKLATLALRRKKSEEELIIAKERAEESDRLKSAFLANMSHEIRTPMNSILGFSELLTKKNLSDEKRERFHKLIEQGGNRLLAIISDIVDISKIDAKQLSFNIDNCNLNSLIDDLYEQFSISPNCMVPLKTKKGLSNEKAYIKTENTRLIQILSNLLENAQKFTKKGEIEFGYTLKRTNIEFYVKDTGIGIEEKDFELIFDRFSQVENDQSKFAAGTGLGLSIAKGLVDLFGGKIWVKSKKGKGTTFFFTIPYHPYIPKSKTNQNKQKGLVDSDHELTILIVEDELTNMIYFEELFEDYNYKLLHAKNGQVALNMVKNHKNIDLILMDVKMSIMDGIESTKEIRKIDKSIPIIAQTAYAMIEDKVKALDAGCNDYLAKPISEKMISDIIKKHVINNKI